jgi:hypothetical protein
MVVMVKMMVVMVKMMVVMVKMMVVMEDDGSDCIDHSLPV